MELKALELELTELLEQMMRSEQEISNAITHVHPEFQPSAKNLYRYLILRSTDLRKYHDILSDLGLSSMRTAEGYVFCNLYHVIRNLRLIQGKGSNPDGGIELIGYQKSKTLLEEHSTRLFGKDRGQHRTQIMVTLPSKAAKKPDMIRKMARNGMEIARINLSHDNLERWTRMVKIIRGVEAEMGKKIDIYMDLPGPKVRTSDISIPIGKKKTDNGIPVQCGESVILTKRETTGKKSRFGKGEKQLEKAEIGVLLPEIIDDAEVGDLVLFDDGMIRSRVIAKRADELELKITDCYKEKISAHKGINLPNTELNLPALTERDREFLPFICKHADMVGYSFVQTREDVRELYAELDKHGAHDIGVVFKIETETAFENLPEILIEAMRRNRIGVMIARGDLAVEIGFERISEVQHEILWLCEAAHIPVIWATQVLENLAKTGIPTRAEISDAAQSAQAECVMLNKGKHINEAITVLNDILARMDGHQFKKKSQLRPLNVARKVVEGLETTTGQTNPG